MIAGVEFVRWEIDHYTLERALQRSSCVNLNASVSDYFCKCRFPRAFTWAAHPQKACLVRCSFRLRQLKVMHVNGEAPQRSRDRHPTSGQP